MADWDSDSDDDYDVFRKKKSRTGEVMEKAMNIAIKRHADVEDYYGPWSVRWNMLCTSDGRPLADTETKSDVLAMINLLTTHIQKRGIVVAALSLDSYEERSVFLSCILNPDADTSERRNETVLSRDVFSTVSTSAVAAVADLASQIDETYRGRWASMKDSTFGLTGQAVFMGTKTGRTKKSSGPDVMKYTLFVHRAAPTARSVQVNEERRKRLRLERDIVETVDRALKKEEEKETKEGAEKK
jgi:hypothetical protein